MSVDGLTNAAMARRPDFQPEGTVQTSLTEIETPQLHYHCQYGASPTSPLAAPIDSLCERYRCPWASYDQSWRSRFGSRTLATVLVFSCSDTDHCMGRVRIQNQGGRKTYSSAPFQGPLWEMSAATIAYVAWTFALSATPFAQEGWYSSGSLLL
jgi:hypothetical protein